MDGLSEDGHHITIFNDLAGVHDGDLIAEVGDDGEIVRNQDR